MCDCGQKGCAACERTDLREAALEGAGWRALPTRRARQRLKGRQTLTNGVVTFGPFVAGEWVIISVVGDDFCVIARSDGEDVATIADPELGEGVHDFVCPDDVADPNRVMVDVIGVNNLGMASVWSNGIVISPRKRGM